MAQYFANNMQAGALQALAATAKTLVGLSAATATLRRAFVAELEVGAASVPNAVDCEIVWDVVRTSTLGTGTNATPSPTDLADVAAGTVNTVNMTIEPTIGVSLLALPLNQRNSQRWIAKDEKSRLVIPATNLAGLATRAKSSTYTGNGIATLVFEE